MQSAARMSRGVFGDIPQRRRHPSWRRAGTLLLNSQHSFSRFFRCLGRRWIKQTSECGRCNFEAAGESACVVSTTDSCATDHYPHLPHPAPIWQRVSRRMPNRRRSAGRRKVGSRRRHLACAAACRFCTDPHHAAPPTAPGEEGPETPPPPPPPRRPRQLAL